MIPSDHAKFRTLRTGSVVWTLRPGADPAALAEVLRDPEKFFVDPTRYVKDTKTITLTRLSLPALPGSRLLLRRLNYGQFRHRLRDFFRPSRAHRALRNAWELEQADLPTARTFAAGDLRRLRWPLRAYVLMEEIPALNLAQWFQQRQKFDHQTVTQIADVLAQMHNRGFSHRDLKWSNLLVNEAARIYLIDLDGVRHCGRISAGLAAEDLSRLARHFVAWPAVLRWSGLRFISRYCRAREPRIDPRPLAADIIRRMGP